MPNTTSIEALSLRTQALSLLEKAAAIDGLSPYLITHSHNHGETTYVAWGVSKPNEAEAVSILEEDFEPDSEGLIVNEATPLNELCGLVPAYRIPDAMAGKVDDTPAAESQVENEANDTPDENLPVVVAFINGGVIHEVAGTIRCRVIFMDEDTEGGDEENIIDIGGDEYYASLHQIEAPDEERVRSIEAVFRAK